MDYLPVFLELRARPAVVVGGGAVGLRKVSWLLRAQASVTVIAAELHAELAALAAGGQIAHRAGRFSAQQLCGAVLVVAATDDREVNRAVSLAAV